MTVRRYDLADMRREGARVRARKRAVAGGFGFGFGSPAASCAAAGTNFEALVSAFTLRLWCRASFAGSPWNGTASGGTSHLNSLTEATNPPSAVSALGFNVASFDGVNDNLDGAALTTFYTTTAQYGWALILVDAITTNDANWGLNDIIAMSNGTLQWGIILRDNAGTRTVEHKLETGGGTRSASVSISLSTWTLVQWKQNGTTISIRTNGNAWDNQTGGTASALSAALSIGGWSSFSDINVAEVAMTEATLSDANFDTVRSYCNQRYGTSV